MAISSLQLLTPDAVERKLADLVRDERLRFGWKQTTLAERSGVSVPTIRRYERTGRTSLRNLLHLLEALGLIDRLQGLLLPRPASSIEELEAREAARKRPRQRGTR
jgi:transcriptional regulator with XRE-family HTH domain